MSAPTDLLDASAWSAALRHVAEAGERLAGELAERGEPGDGDALAATLGALVDTYLFQLCADVDCPTFVPTCAWFQHTGSPNPDTVYRRAVIDGAGTYRVTGERGTAREATVMPFPTMESMGTISWQPFDLSELTVDERGRFEVLLCASRPSGHTGDWWSLDPRMGSLWLRSVDPDWAAVVDARLAIERVDGAPHRPRRSNRRIVRRLATLGPIVEGTLLHGLGHADQLVADGFVNRLTTVSYEAQGGLQAQWYHEGVFELAAGEALLVEAALPEGCRYFSVSLTDRMLVTLDWANAPTSLNSHQATVADGVLRMVVSADDPGIANWLDTCGRHTGVVQCRWGGSTEPPVPTSEVVPVAALAGAVHPDERVGAQQRASELRARRSAAQLRRPW